MLIYIFEKNMQKQLKIFKKANSNKYLEKTRKVGKGKRMPERRKEQM